MAPFILAGSTPTTYQDIIDVAQVALRDKQGANWDEQTDLLPLLELMVQTMITIMGNTNPEMVWIEDSITLNETDGYGPYYMDGNPADFKSIARMENDQHKEVKKGSRDKSYHHYGSGRPDRYWTEGFNPTKIYFNRDIPDGESYVYPVWYIPIVARNTDLAAPVPLPNYFFEALVEWLVKLAGNIDEYITSGEDGLINIFTPVVNSILDARSSELEVEVENLGF